MTQYFFYISAVLFCIGVFLAITRRNAVAVLIGVELILNAANLNFIAFSQLNPERLDGQMVAIFSIVIAAAEAAVALAIILTVYKTHKTVNLDDIDELKN